MGGKGTELMVSEFLSAIENDSKFFQPRENFHQPDGLDAAGNCP